MNQSKISRLIRKLDAIKSKNELGEVVYRIAREPAPPTTESQLGHLIISIEANESLILVNTSPGAAQLIARVLDYHRNKLHILGTIAGDDTILIAPSTIKKIPSIVNELKSLLLSINH